MRRAVLLLALLAGCARFEPDYGWIYCGESGECPASLVCDTAYDLCLPPLPDAGPVDAGVAIDAGPDARPTCATGDACDSNVCDPIEHHCVAEENVVYLSGDGLAQDCGTKAAPCRLVEHVVPQLEADRPYLAVEGVVQAASFELPGLAIVVGSTGATIDFSNAEVGGMGAGLVVDGLTVTGSRSAGIYAVASALRVSRSVVRSNLGPAIQSGGELTVLDSQILDNGAGIVGGRLTLVGNRIEGNLGRAVEGKASGSEIRNNLIAGNRGGVMKLESFDVDKVQAIVAYNTIVGNESDPAEGATIWCSGYTFSYRPLLDSNIIWDQRFTSDPDDPLLALLDTCTVGDNVSDAPLNAMTIHGDPLFVDADNGDFHLLRGSSADAVGTLQYALPIDLEGTPRSTSTPDMGAFELP